MPSGKVHDAITVVTAVAAVPLWYVLCPGHDVAPIALVIGSYVFSGFWLSDDLDTRSVSYRRWGPLRFLWWPYQKLVPHRSWISHGIGIGPLLRVVYFGLMLWATARCVMWGMFREGVNVDRDAVLGSLWTHGAAWTLTHPSTALWITLGLVLGGIAHSVADSVVSFAKKVW
jgi:uncharacterized metal-binding protein